MDIAHQRQVASIVERLADPHVSRTADSTRLARCSPASRRAADGALHAGFGLDPGCAPRPSATIGGPKHRLRATAFPENGTWSSTRRGAAPSHLAIHHSRDSSS
jgi:hypothetical protein